MSLQELRNFQLFDTVERRAKLKHLSEHVLNDNDEKRRILALSALDDESIHDDFQLFMDVLAALGSESRNIYNIPRGTPVSDLALCLSDSVFPEVRSAAVSSGLLSNEDALRTLLCGRADLSKPILQARTEGRYSFGYTPGVGLACDRVYDDRAALCKVLSGADLVNTVRGSRPKVGDIKFWSVLVSRLPPQKILTLAREVDGLLSARWLKLLLRRCETLDPEEEAETVREIINWVLYCRTKWHPRVCFEEEASEVIKYLWRRQGPLTTEALASYNPGNDPILSLDEMLRFSSYTSWDQQIEAFGVAKDKIGTEALPLRYIKHINKSGRSRHCRKLLDLLTSVTDTPRQLVNALRGLISREQLPPIALGEFIAHTLLEAVTGDSDLLLRSFEMGRKLLQRPHCPISNVNNEEQKQIHAKGPPPPYVEYIDDPARMKLFSSMMSHKRVRDVMDDNALGYILQAFVTDCVQLETLREGTSFFISVLGDSVRSDMLIDASLAMAKADAAQLDIDDNKETSTANHNCEGLPFELLKYICEANDAYGSLLLEQIAGDSTSSALVTRFGRSAWWELLIFGLGGPLLQLKPVRQPKIITSTVDGISEIDSEHFVIIASENQRSDEFFVSTLLNGCTGRDLDRRREGLKAVLDSCQHTTEFRLRRLAYVIRRVATEPDHTKQALVPIIFRTIRDVKEWVQLATELSSLWDKCTTSSFLANTLTQSFVTFAKQACQKVIDGALPEDNAGAKLAATVVEYNDRDWIEAELLKVVAADERSREFSEIIQFLLSAALKSCVDIVSLIMMICKSLDQDPHQLLEKQWAATLHEKLVQCCDDPEFVLVEALESLTRNNVESGWMPVKDETVEATVNSLEASDDIISATSLLLRHLKSLKEYQEQLALSSDVLSRAKKSVVYASNALVSVFSRSDENDDTFAVSLGKLFSSKRIMCWEDVVPASVALALSEAAAKRRVFKWESEDRATSACILEIWHESSNGTASAEIVARSDALDAVIISHEVARDLVSFKPALLHKLVRSFPPQTKSTVHKWGALAGKLEFLLREDHLPCPVAAEIARVMSSTHNANSTLCLARLLREVNTIDILLQRMEAIEDIQEVTAVVKAATDAGHPMRTAELVMRGTDIKEQIHRSSLERSLADLPVERTQQMIEKILSDETMNPAVIKICLRLFECVSICEPERLLLTAWRGGRCHPDVDVHIKAIYASSSTRYSANNQELLFDAKVVDKTRFSFIARELIEALRGTPWSSVPLICFLSTAIDEGAVRANVVFPFIVDRLCLEADFCARDEAVVFLTQLISRGRSLRDPQLHGMINIVSDWRGCSPDHYQFYNSDQFILSLQQLKKHSTSQEFILALAGNKPASDNLISIWAKIFLTGASIESGGDSPFIDLGFRLARGERRSLLRLCNTAVTRAIQEPSHAVIAAALAINKRVYEETQCSLVFVETSATLAAISSDTESLLAQYDAAVTFDAREEDEEGEGIHKCLHLIKAIESVAGLHSCPDAPYLHTLLWMQSKAGTVLLCSPLVSAAKHLAVKLIQVRPSLSKEVTMSLLLFRDHGALYGFDHVLLGFDRDAMLLWVGECVRLHEMAVRDNTSIPPKCPLFNDAVMRAGAAPILASSSFSDFRLRSLGYLPTEKVKEMGEQDEDYSVRTIARLLIKRATDQSKLELG